MPPKVRVDVGDRTPVGARCRTCSRPRRSRTPKTSWTLFRQQTVSATQRASSGAGEATARPYGRLYRHAASHKMLGRPSASRGSTSSRIPGLATRWFSTWSRAASSPAPSRSSADEHPEMPLSADGIASDSAARPHVLASIGDATHDGRSTLPPCSDAASSQQRQRRHRQVPPTYTQASGARFCRSTQGPSVCPLIRYRRGHV